MRPVIAHERCILFHGDSAELSLPENSVDAIVCDPPAGIGFMGKSWDEDKGGRDAWIAWLAKTLGPAFRALKPGGHALVWALPRTSHWTALALEAAGFEIRDRVSHLFGTGFPKSLNVSKAIDAHLGKERPVVGVAQGVGSRTGVSYSDEDRTDGAGGGFRSEYEETAPGSTEASQWNGWGTALKPACEDWWLVRKPLEGTVARNVLQYGTGGLNIDGTRIGDSKDVPASASSTRPGGRGEWRMGASPGSGSDPNVGRWPAHVILDEEAAALLDEQSGISKSTGGNSSKPSGFGEFGGGKRTVTKGKDPGFGDTGGASRFFYVAKGSRAEKDAGLAHLTPKTAGEATDREENTAGLQNPRAGAGRTGGARNFHPTVKSIALMRWLVRLITPPGGVVLDPFAGSGSTGVAALAEGFSFIGVEMTSDYLPIIEGRLRHALGDS